MPIHCSLKFQPLTNEVFQAIDRLTMACCFESQNALGRLCDERVYENDVAERLARHGFSEVLTQMPIMVVHETYTKTYRIDLVVDQMIYDLKVVAAFTPDHCAQGLHYAALAGTDRVKLVNFRLEKVTGKLLRSPLWKIDRRCIRVTASRWQPLSESCENLRTRTRALLEDWGAFLATQLYEEALIHFFGGETHCLRRLKVVRDSIELGTHRLACHAGNVGFVLTAFTGEAEDYEMQLHRLLRYLPLCGIQWINLNHTELQFVTLINSKRHKSN